MNSFLNLSMRYANHNGIKPVQASITLLSQYWCAAADCSAMCEQGAAQSLRYIDMVQPESGQGPLDEFNEFEYIEGFGEEDHIPFLKFR